MARRTDQRSLALPFGERPVQPDEGPAPALHSPPDLLAWAEHALAPWGQIPARHHRFMIKKLEDIAAGRIDRLMLLLPPGHAKSTYALLNMLLGSLAAMTTSVVSYWVGSSAGSASKTEMLYRSSPPAADSK